MLVRTRFSAARQAVASAMLALVAGVAQANTATVEFGTLLSGAGAPTTANFAELTVQDVGNNAVFSLRASDLALFSGSAPFLGAIGLELSGYSSSVGSVTDVSGGVTSISISNGGGPGGSWDMRFNFGQGANNRLLNGETVTWTWVGGAGLWDEAGMAAHVQGISYGGTTSAWYRADSVSGGGGIVTTPTVVPEPATMACLAWGCCWLEHCDGVLRVHVVVERAEPD